MKITSTSDYNEVYYNDLYRNLETLRDSYEVRLMARNMLSVPQLRSLKNKNCLEIGFGTGYLYENLLKKDPKTLTGIDQNKLAVTYMKSRLSKDKRTHFYQGDANNLKKCLPDKKYDVIVSSNLIEHLAEDQQFLEDCIDLLAPKGKLVLTFPTEHSQPDKLHFRTYNPNSFKNHIKEKYGQEVDVIGCAFHPPALMEHFTKFIMPIFLKMIPGWKNQAQIKSGEIREEKIPLSYKVSKKVYYISIVPLFLVIAFFDSLIAKVFKYGSSAYIAISKK